jgi:molecular chaperone DnaJ
MSERDYYDVLGVARTADTAQLRAAFRAHAKKLHPDTNPNDPSAEQKFKELNEAYAVLSDPEKRAAYDRFGKAAFQGGGPGGGSGGGAGFPGFGGFQDIFREFFGEDFEDVFSGRGGSGGGGRRSERGSDLRYDVEITLEEAFKGAEREIVVPSAAVCTPCNGSGAEAGAKPETCATCQGRGQVLMGDRSGFFRMARTCPACQGRGTVISNPCKSCGGRGLIQKDKRLAVRIPAGVEDGSRIRLAGEGDVGPNGGQAGDLYIFLSIKPHTFFERDGRELFCRATVPMTTAALGGRIDIPTIDGGRTELVIPEGAQTGRRFRMRGAGMTALNSRERGDLHVEMVIETPINLTAKQRRLLEDFQAACGEDAHPQSQGFFDSVRRFFENKGDAPGR